MTDQTSTAWTQQHQEASEPDFYGKWIDVDLLTPEDDTMVLAACDDDVCECKHTENGQFVNCAYAEFKGTHWMPLPPPPTL